MRNRYPGICYYCHTVVNKGDGHFEKMPLGGWRVIHADCVFKQRDEKAVKHLEQLELRKSEACVLN